MDLLFVVLFCVLILCAGVFVLLLFTGAIGIKGYTPPPVNGAVLVGIISGLSALALPLLVSYPLAIPWMLVGLGVLAVAVVYRDRKKRKQEGQAKSSNSNLRLPAQKQSQPKEAREE